MKLLVDNNLPPALGRGLGAMFADDHEVIHIKDKFGTGSLSDEDWIERLAAEGGWSVLSGDRRHDIGLLDIDLLDEGDILDCELDQHRDLSGSFFV